MKQQWHLYSTKTRYTKLLLGILFVFILFPFGVIFPILKYLIAFVFLGMIVFAIDTLSLPPKTMFFLRGVAVSAFLADIISFPHSPPMTALFSLISYVCYSLFLIPSIGAIALRVNDEEKVDEDVIRGGICVYLLLGILWFLFYLIVVFFDQNAFDIPEKFQVENILLYFSFTTLTTVGYGDITPINQFAMMLTNGEALLGQLYPAIFIAKLVGLYGQDK